MIDYPSPRSKYRVGVAMDSAYRHGSGLALPFPFPAGQETRPCDERGAMQDTHDTPCRARDCKGK